MPRQDHEHSVGFRPDGFISQGKNLHLVPFPSFRTAVTKSACWAPALRLHPGPRHRPPGFLPPDTRQAPSAFRSRLAGSPLSPVGQAGPPHTAPLGQSSPAASEESPRTGGRGHFPLDTGRPPEPPPSRLPRLGGRRWAGAFSALLSPRSLGVCRPPSSTPTGEYACRLPRLPPPPPSRRCEGGRSARTNLGTLPCFYRSAAQTRGQGRSRGGDPSLPASAEPDALLRQGLLCYFLGPRAPCRHSDGRLNFCRAFGHGRHPEMLRGGRGGGAALWRCGRPQGPWVTRMGCRRT